MTRNVLVVLIASLMFSCAQKKEFVFPEEGIEIAKVISGVNVGFKMLEENDKLYFAYYDSIHQMTLATLDLKTGEKDYQVMPTKIGWDSHNYVNMAFDKEGFLHVSGNMHAIPLIYFRSEQPYDIHSMKQIKSMTGMDEERVTYPVFMNAPDGNMIFHYRIGGSGNGSEIYNIYDVTTKTWKRLLDKPLTDGKGERNAYMQGPKLSTDGYYHLIWVWRETPDCSTNHTLSYARSKDLIHWENAAGEATELPITLEKKEFYVDATPVKGGLFNPGIMLGFDSKGTPIIGYHKYDADGNNQLYATRFENGEWKRKQLTHWTYRWQFEGNGSMKNELDIYPPKSIGDGKMAFGYWHIKEGSGEIIFDENTLEAVGKRELERSYPAKYDELTSTFPNMKSHVSLCGDYLMHWETLPTNRDRKPEGELPPPSSLMLYKWK